jgi:hypothetical protein
VSTQLQRSASLFCMSSIADLTSPRSLLRSLSVSMTAARSSHLSQTGRGWVDNGESEEEEGEKAGPEVVGGWRKGEGGGGGRRGGEGGGGAKPNELPRVSNHSILQA